MGNSVSFRYNAAGQRSEVTNALGGVTRYEYDGAGNLIAETDALGNRVLWE